MTSAVYTAPEIAGLIGMSPKRFYEHRDDFPVPALRVGRKLFWPKAPVDHLLGLGPENGEGPGTTPDLTPHHDSHALADNGSRDDGTA